MAPHRTYGVVTTICIILLIAAYSESRAQYIAPVPPCVDTDLDVDYVISPLSTEQGDGMHITSHGPVKVLFIMIRWPDDGYLPNHPIWPLNQDPIWVTNPGVLATPTNQYSQQNWLPTWNPVAHSLTDYFYEMSANQVDPDDRYRVYGDFFEVVLPYTRAQAQQQGINVGEAIVDAIELLDQTMDFGVYDMHTTIDPYQHTLYAEDDVLDMVYVCFRNQFQEFNLADPQMAQLRNYMVNSGFNSLAMAHMPPGFIPTTAGLPMTNRDWIDVDRIFNPVTMAQIGQRRITVNFADSYPAIQTPLGLVNQSTGCSVFFNNVVTAQNQFVRATGAREDYFRGMVHEYGHQLLTGGHVQSAWTMIRNGDNRSYAPSASEMHMLGWANPTFVMQNTNMNQLVNLGDLYSTGQCIAVEVDETANQWYWLENHQMISDYDYPSTDVVDRSQYSGLYTLFNNHPGTSNKTDVLQYIQSAQGSFDWDGSFTIPNPFTQNPNDVLPSFMITGANAGTGYSRSQMVDAHAVVNGTSRHPIYFTRSINGQGQTVVEEHHYYLGGEPGDQYLPCVRPSWGPGTNPASSYFNYSVSPAVTVQSGASFYIEAQAGTNLMVRVASDNLDIIPPQRVNAVTAPSQVTEPALDIAVPLTVSFSVSWTGVTQDADRAGFRVTGGDQDVTVASSVFSTTVNVTIPGGDREREVDIDVRSFDSQNNPNISCGSVAGVVTVTCTKDLPSTVDEMRVASVQLNPAFDFGSPRSALASNNIDHPKLVVLHDSIDFTNEEQIPLVLSIYPNPASEFIVVQASIALATQASWRVQNLKGNKVLESANPINKGESTWTVDVRTLPSGVYALEVAIGNSKRVAHFTKR